MPYGYDRIPMADPIGAAVGTYSALKGIDLDERRLALQEKTANLNNKILQGQIDAQAREQELRDWTATKSLIQADPQGWYTKAPPHIVQKAMEQIGTDPQYAYLKDPNSRVKVMGALNTLKMGFSNPAATNQATMLDAANTVLAPRLNLGAADDGQSALNKRIVGIHDSGDGHNHYLELEVTRQNGTTYRAPLTEGRSADPNDPVKPVTFEAMFDHMTGTEGIINMVNAKMISLGDKELPKQMEERRRGKEVMTALGGIDPNASVQAQRMSALGAFANAGQLPMGVQALPNLIPDKAPIFQKMWVGDGDARVEQWMVSHDNGKNFSPFGASANADKPDHTVTKEDPMAKHQWDLTMKEIDKQESRVNRLRGTIDTYRANIGNEISVVDEFGNSKKVVAKKAEIDTLVEQLKLEEKKRDDLYIRARSVQGAAFGQSAQGSPAPPPSGGGSGSIVAGVNLQGYAEKPTHIPAVRSVYTNVSGMNTPQEFDAYIKHIAPRSPITGQMVVDSANRHGIDPRVLIAAIQVDSQFGTAGLATKTRNPGNVGGDNPTKRWYANTWEEGLDFASKELARRRVGTRQALPQSALGGEPPKAPAQDKAGNPTVTYDSSHPTAPGVLTNDINSAMWGSPDRELIDMPTPDTPRRKARPEDPMQPVQVQSSGPPAGAVAKYGKFVRTEQRDARGWTKWMTPDGKHVWYEPPATSN